MAAPMRYQPQGLARLNRGSPLVAGAQAVISAAQPVNLVSLVPLKTAGTITQGLSPNGKVYAFRKNGYVETETLPAIGTASFVEFWCGVPSADRYAKGNSNDLGFLTGSGANQIGIIGSVGTNQSSANPGQWGAVRDWSSSSRPMTGEVLAAGVWTVLVVVRRQAGMEFWHNGTLVYSYPSSPVSYSAQTMICGSFIEDTSYWPSSSDTMLAGRIASEWTADQVKQFSANPWQLFDAGSSGSAYQAAIASVAAATGGTITTLNPAPATLTLTGYAPSVIQPRTLAPGPAALALTGGAPSVVQPKTLTPGTAALALTGYAPTVTQVMPQTLAPASALLTLSTYAPTITQGAQVPAPISDGGGAGSVREVRAYADLLNRASKPTRSQKKARRRALEAEALELLPDLPQAEALAPIAARIVYEQEARAMAPLYANRPIQALAPVVVPFDAHAALRDLVARLLAEAETHRDLGAEDEFETELLLLGS